MTPPRRPPPRRPRPRPLFDLRPEGDGDAGINGTINRWLIAILALVVVGGIGILLLGGSGSSPATPRQLAERDVAERLAAAPLPPRAERVESLPESLHLDGPGEPATPNLVDRDARYVDSMSAAKALAWLEAHPPHGSKRSGAGGPGADGGTVVHEVAFAWPDLPKVRERELIVAVAARPGGGSALRLSSQAAWIAPHRRP